MLTLRFWHPCRHPSIVSPQHPTELLSPETRHDPRNLGGRHRHDRAVEAFKVSLTDNQFATLVSFVFSMGEGQFRSSTLPRKLNRGDYASAPAELLKRISDSGRRIAGLADRCNAAGCLWVTVRSSFMPRFRTRRRRRIS